MATTNIPDQIAPNQTTVIERMEKNKFKIPTLSDIETDLTKTNPRRWWEPISEYIDDIPEKLI